MKFIRLTKFPDRGEVFVNMALVTEFFSLEGDPDSSRVCETEEETQRWKEETRTRLIYGFWADEDYACLDVCESPDTILRILAMIEKMDNRE